MTKKDFIALSDFSTTELTEILQLAQKLKAKPVQPDLLPGKQLAMIFAKNSTRTRVSFEVGINQLGGSAVVMHAEQMQLGRGETIADTAKVLSRYVDLIMIRADQHSELVEFAQHATVPVINGLTDYNHPCQLMADLLTFIELRGDLSGKTICYAGDGNNMCNSWLNAARIFDFKLKLAVHESYLPDAKLLANALDSHNVELFYDLAEAAQDADLITTDTWVSMGDANAKQRLKDFAFLQVNQEIMQLAKADCLFMHCLPAHRGEEVSSSVIDGQQSVVFQEAENRLHAQKAIMLYLMQNYDAS